MTWLTVKWRVPGCAIGIAAVIFACLAAEPSQDNSGADWRGKFDEVYRLGDDEVVRFIPRPFIPDRNAYCRHQFTDNPNAPLETDSWSLVFRWVKAKAQFWSVSSLPGTVGRIIESVGIERVDLEMSDDVRNTPAPGDWIVREDAGPRRLLPKVRDILLERFDRRIKFERVKVRKDVLVARGRYAFHAFRGAPANDTNVHLFCGETFPVPADGPQVGGGGGNVAKFLRHVAERAGMKMIDETTPTPETPATVSYRLHGSSWDAKDDAEKRESLIKNVEAQTSLALTVEQREVEIWRITDEGEPVGL